MTKVLHLHPPPEPDLRLIVADLAERLAELEARVPPKRFTVPPGWLTAKVASALCGYSGPHLYAVRRRGHVVGVKLGGAVYFDPSTLPKRTIK